MHRKPKCAVYTDEHALTHTPIKRLKFIEGAFRKLYRIFLFDAGSQSPVLSFPLLSAGAGFGELHFSCVKLVFVMHRYRTFVFQLIFSQNLFIEK